MQNKPEWNLKNGTVLGKAKLRKDVLRQPVEINLSIDNKPKAFIKLDNLIPIDGGKS